MAMAVLRARYGNRIRDSLHVRRQGDTCCKGKASGANTPLKDALERSQENIAFALVQRHDDREQVRLCCAERGPSGLRLWVNVDHQREARLKWKGPGPQLCSIQRFARRKRDCRQT